MRVQYDPDFIRTLKKQNVRIRKSFREAIEIFHENPLNSRLNNHKLKGKYEGHESINITSDWRAIYEEVKETKGVTIAYFVALGTHRELYK